MTLTTCPRCGAPVRWVVLLPSDIRLPLDPEPVPGGSICLYADGVHGSLLTSVNRPLLTPRTKRYRVHTARCPQRGRNHV